MVISKKAQSAFWAPYLFVKCTLWLLNQIVEKFKIAKYEEHNKMKWWIYNSEHPSILCYLQQM